MLGAGRRRYFLIIPALLLSFFVVLSCQKKEGGVAREKKLFVVTTLFPLYDFSRIIGGPKADVSLLVPPGVEPHNFELRPADLIRIENSDVFVYTGPAMEPWVGRLLKGVGDAKVVVVDASAGIPLARKAGAAPDPHVWLDFSLAARMVENIAAGFVRQDPANRDFFEGNARAYKQKLLELDGRFRETLSRCRKNIILHAGHFTFGYLAKRYGLEYVSAYPGFAPDTEPTPRRMIRLSDLVRKYGIHYIFYEELIMPRAAEAISRETGARLLPLHGAHNVTKQEMEGGVTFLSLMEKNLDNLRVGLECQ